MGPGTSSLDKTEGKRERNKAENRRAILVAARDVFLELGYGAATVRDIIRRTGLASGTFYNYYPDKKSVFVALLQEHFSILNRLMHDARTRARTPEEFLAGPYRFVFSAITQDRRFFDLVRRNSGTIRSLLDDAMFGVSIKEMKADIEAAIDRGVLPPTDTSFLAAALAGIGFELGVALADREMADLEKAIKFATDFALGGINNTKPVPQS